LSIKVVPPEFIGFTASASVWRPDDEYSEGKLNRDMFLNLKAQTWWLLADRFRNTYDAINGKDYDPEQIISLPSNLPNLDALRGELSQPRREFLNGKFRVEPKDKMLKRGVKSPNLADSLCMCFSPEESFNLTALL
jgi:phage terminase large subunit